MTTYTSLYELVRTAAGDFAGTAYSADYCRKAISLSILDMSAYAEVIIGAIYWVNPSIDGNDKFELVCRAALCLLQPEDPFSYRTAVISVTRKGTGLQNRIDWLQQKVMELESGGTPMAADGSMEYYMESAERFEDFINSYA